MKRAAIFIGVDRTGTLPVLRDAAKGARRMAELWGEGQGLESAVLITDENGGTVTARMIKDAVNAAIRLGVEQLIVYFAGHGINRNRGEYWLLSGAPDDPQEAVNVAGSEDLARTCGIAHVVLISDACRTAADSILAGSVTGSEIFPNKDGPEKPVDQFFACRLGMPSNEAKDVKAASKEFKALYTEELLPALRGKVEKLLKWKKQGKKRIAYIRPRPLADHLRDAMLVRLSAPEFAGRVVQEPSARILSADPAWISVVETQVAFSEEARRDRGQGSGRIDMAITADLKELLRAAAAPSAPSAATVSSSLVQAALKSPGALASALSYAGRSGTPLAKDLVKSATDTAVPFGPSHQESHCGFKIRGGAIVEARSLHGRTQLRRKPGDVVRMWDVPRPGTIVLLKFEDGAGVVLPAIPDYLCALTIQGGELTDVAFEPSENTGYWYDFQRQAEEIRALRGVVSASARSGVFHLEGEDALKLARRMQKMKAIDPALAVYAAYAYNDLQRHDLLKEMDKYMRRTYGGALFDVAMLARTLGKTPAGGKLTMHSFAPLLAQGWAYLGARRIKLAPGLEDLPRMLKDSLWAMFKPEGVKRLGATIFRGRAR